MKTIELTQEEFEAMNQIEAYQNLIKAAKKTNRMDVLIFAQKQLKIWYDKFFGIKINWI